METVDITCTVKPEEAKGRRLMKELVGGRVFYAEDEPKESAPQKAPSEAVVAKKTHKVSK